MNPNVGLIEINGIQQMSDDDFEMYLDNAVMLYCQSQGPMPPSVFRSLLSCADEVIEWRLQFVAVHESAFGP
ncbi:MAG: hypothetical protein WA322_27615 [Pseudolabrys sp.]